MTEQRQPLYAYEDFHEGRVFPLGPLEVRAEDIVEFASEFDPQPMHLDEAAGRDSVLGGLSASGWHTASLMMRMMADSYILDSTCEGAPGIERMDWKRPLIAGDTLRGTTTVTARRLSSSRPHIGLVSVRHDLTNQRGETVALCSNTVMMALRHRDRQQ